MGSTSNNVLGKRPRRCEGISNSGKDDVFSRLPDEIVYSHILSRLHFKQAAQTSVLSRRWKKLWTCNPNLTFSDRDDLGFINDDLVSQEVSRQRVVRQVNRYLELHQSPTLELFRIDFNMDSSCSYILDGWLQIAFRKGVQNLGLSLYGNKEPNQYAFPDAQELKNFLSTLSPLNSNPSDSSSNLVCAGICKLRSLCLRGVDINQEALEYLLSNSPFLELFYVMELNNLVGLNVPSQARKLQLLIVFYCRDMKRLVVSKSNLAHLVYLGSKITLTLENVPLLSFLSIGGKHSDIFIQMFSLHFGLLSQLRILSLHMSKKMVRESVFLPREVPELSNLEHLQVSMSSGDDGLCLLWPTILVKAAPLLRKFSVQFDSYKRKLGSPESEDIRNRRYEINRIVLEKATKHTHPCLKVVELKGFIGSRNQVELAQHLLCIAESLDKLVLDVERSTSREDLENLADELRGALPSGAKLVLRK